VKLKLVVVQDTDGTYLVSSKRFLAHGTGQTVPDALRDFADVLDELYDLIQLSADQGNANDKHQLQEMEALGVVPSERAHADTLVHLAAEAAVAAHVYREAAKEYQDDPRYLRLLETALDALRQAVCRLEEAE
jgi:hypothetical protein